MNIIFGQDRIKDIDDRYIVLELDTFRLDQHPEPVTAYCLIESLGLEEIALSHHYRDLHAKLIKNYRERNWIFCEQALEHLNNKWRGDVNSFYNDLTERIKAFRENDPGPDWDGIIDRTDSAA